MAELSLLLTGFSGGLACGKSLELISIIYIAGNAFPARQDDTGYLEKKKKSKRSILPSSAMRERLP